MPPAVTGAAGCRTAKLEWLPDGSGATAHAVRPAFSVHPLVTEGHPAEVLLTAASGAELLVVGSRGHGGFASALTGSVSMCCVLHAHCPVLVVRDRQ